MLEYAFGGLFLLVCFAKHIIVGLLLINMHPSIMIQFLSHSDS